jgi:hypothetical protein
VGVQVDRQIEPGAQRPDQGSRDASSQQPGHVLDTQDLNPSLDQTFGDLE